MMRSYYRPSNHREQGLKDKLRGRLNKSYRQHQRKKKIMRKLLKKKIRRKKKLKCRHKQRRLYKWERNRYQLDLLLVQKNQKRSYALSLPPGGQQGKKSWRKSK